MSPTTETAAIPVRPRNSAEFGAGLSDSEDVTPDPESVLAGEDFEAEPVLVLATEDPATVLEGPIELAGVLETDDVDAEPVTVGSHWPRVTRRKIAHTIRAVTGQCILDVARAETAVAFRALREVAGVDCRRADTDRVLTIRVR
jgi:hypothetical protein